MEKLTIKIRPKRFVNIDEMIIAGDAIAKSLDDWAITPDEFIDTWSIKPNSTGCSYKFVRKDGKIYEKHYTLGYLFNVCYSADWKCYR